MTELIPDIEEILNKLSKENISGNNVAIILNNPREYPKSLIEIISLETAIKYWNEKMNFEDGDCIMNNIYNFWTSNEYYFTNFGFSDIAWECYEAFDSGEYYREDDEQNIDLAKKYTRPQIEDLLRKRNKIE